MRIAMSKSVNLPMNTVFKKALSALIFACTVLCSATASPFKLNITGDAVTLASSSLLTGADYVFEKQGVFKDFVWNGESFDSSDVFAIDRALMQPYSKTLHKVSTVSAAACMALPGAVIFADSDWFTIGVMYAETLLSTIAVKNFLKAVVFRPRPYMYFSDAPQDKIDEGDWCCSFPSGHTAYAFAGAGFVSYVFAKCHPDSKWKIPVIAGSYSVAAATGIMRIASGNHFLTDVLTGAVIGTAAGILVPLFHTDIFGSNVTVSPAPYGFSCTIML